MNSILAMPLERGLAATEAFGPQPADAFSPPYEGRAGGVDRASDPSRGDGPGSFSSVLKNRMNTGETAKSPAAADSQGDSATEAADAPAETTSEAAATTEVADATEAAAAEIAPAVVGDVVALPAEGAEAVDVAGSTAKADSLGGLAGLKAVEGEVAPAPAPADVPAAIAVQIDPTLAAAVPLDVPVVEAALPAFAADPSLLLLPNSSIEPALLSAVVLADRPAFATAAAPALTTLTPEPALVPSSLRPDVASLETALDSTADDLRSTGTGAALDAAPRTAGALSGLAQPTVVEQSTAAQLAERIVVWGRMTTVGSRTEFELRLEPPELGSLRIQLTATEEAVHVRLIAVDQVSRDLIESQLESLKRSLEEAGIQLGQCEVDCQAGSDDASEIYEEPSEFHAVSVPLVEAAMQHDLLWMRDLSVVTAGRVNVVV